MFKCKVLCLDDKPAVERLIGREVSDELLSRRTIGVVTESGDLVGVAFIVDYWCLEQEIALCSLLGRRRYEELPSGQQLFNHCVKYGISKFVVYMRVMKEFYDAEAMLFNEVCLRCGDNCFFVASDGGLAKYGVVSLLMSVFAAGNPF